jgi:hypothetical protein
MKKNRRLKSLILIALLSVIIVTIIAMIYVVYENSDLKKRRAFSDHVSLFKSLEDVPDSSYQSMEAYFNKTAYLDSISNILGIQIAAIDFGISGKTRNIYIHTEPYFDYSGYFYNSNAMQLNCMLRETETLLTENPQLKLSVVKLNENWVTYRKNKKDIPIDLLYFNNILGLNEKCK